MSTAICFNLDQPKMLSSDNELIEFRSCPGEKTHEVCSGESGFTDLFDKSRCACETLMPQKHPFCKKHDPDI